jgi:hypothetical protein
MGKQSKRRPATLSTSSLKIPFGQFNMTVVQKDVPIWGISCRHRADRRNRMEKEWKARGLSLNWFIVDRHESDGKQGCWESHAALWRKAKKEGIEWLCVVEDDAQWIGSHTNFPVIPFDAKMAYLGGQIHWTWEDPIQEASHWENGKLKQLPAEWIRAVVWTTHAYLICLRDDTMPDLLKQFMSGELPYRSGYEVDKFFVEQIHPKEPCYAIRNIRVIQRGDFSDIEGCEVDYTPMLHTPWGIPKPKMEKGEEGELRVPLPNYAENELPKVSIITPTWGRAHLFPWTIRNVLTQWYPLNKIEWIILEEDWNEYLDSPYRRKTIDTEDIPKPSEVGGLEVRYVKVKPTLDGKPQTIAYKRNLGCELGRGNIIACFDDDDYYPPTSLMSRVKILLTYRNKLIVGTSLVAGYDVHEEKSGFLTDGRLALGEASMAFWRRAWLNQPFDPKETRGEYRSFLSGRWDECMDLPSVFIIYAMRWKQHGGSSASGTGERRPMTGAKWRESNNDENVDFRQWWDQETLEVLQQMKEIDSQKN